MCVVLCCVVFSFVFGCVCECVRFEVLVSGLREGSVVESAECGARGVAGRRWATETKETERG